MAFLRLANYADSERLSCFAASLLWGFGCCFSEVLGQPPIGKYCSVAELWAKVIIPGV